MVPGRYREKLPYLVPPGRQLGTVSPLASRQTGIPAGVPVIACGSDKVFEPDPSRVDLYRRLYRRVYRKIYKAMAPLYAEIKKITGYPA